jgi:hypothetical protein
MGLSLHLKALINGRAMPAIALCHCLSLMVWAELWILYFLLFFLIWEHVFFSQARGIMIQCRETSKRTECRGGRVTDILDELTTRKISR